MIDEDLYQQATDELNSDKRRPHIWARACALASDDHDEARYLYTNLRVEELIAERDANDSGSNGASEKSTHDQQDVALTLEPLDSNEEKPESISAPSGVDQNRGSDENLTLDAMSVESNEVIETIDRKSFEEKFEAIEESGKAEQRAVDEQIEGSGRFEERAEESDRLEQLSEEDGSASIDDPDELAYAEEYLDETINLTSELDGTAVFELDTSATSEFAGDALALDETGEMSRADEKELDELEALLGGVYQGREPPQPTNPLAEDNSDSVMTLDFSDVTGTQTHLDDSVDDHLDELLDDSIEWPEGELSPEDYSREVQKYASQSSTGESMNETGRLAQELERQARDLPGQRSDIVAENSRIDEFDSSTLSEEELALATGDTFDEESERDIAESLRQKNAGHDVEHPDDAEAGEELPQHDVSDDSHDNEQMPVRQTGDISPAELPAAAAMAAAGAASASHSAAHGAHRLPLDLSEQQTGRRYTIFRRGEQAQAVKNGVSWPALFLTLPYLVYRHLFGTALVYGVMWLIIVTGLLVSGLAWLDAGSLAGTTVKFSTAGFALLALAGLLYLPFRYANQWREEKLEERGFELVARVRASSPGKAISAARQAATLD